MTEQKTPKQLTLDYLAKHNITEVLEKIVNKLVNVKPSNPWAFLATEFQGLAQAVPGQPEVVFVLGGPGSGKGTQCARIVKEFGYVHLSAGDLLRAARSSGDATGALIENYIKEGKIVPVEITVNLIKKAMEDNAKQGKAKFLVDGFPRNQDNVEGWERVMGSYAHVRLVLFFDCPEKVMEGRLLERGKTSGRTDDNAESIRKRFKTYMDETMPVIESFDKQSKVRKINAEPPEEQVFGEVRKHFA